MKRIITPLISIALILTLACSCATIKRSGGNKGILQGMLYDYENRPICGYIFSLDNAEKTATDINGRFIFADIPFGPHLIEGESTTYISYHENFDFNDKTQILYIRIPSNNWLYTYLDKNIENADFIEAEKTLSLFSDTEKKAEQYKLYFTICKYRTALTIDKPLFLKLLEPHKRGKR